MNLFKKIDEIIVLWVYKNTTESQKRKLEKLAEIDSTFGSYTVNILGIWIFLILVMVFIGIAIDSWLK